MPSMWQGNTADVTALVPVGERLQKRSDISSFCVVGDRGLVSNDTLEKLEQLSNRKPVPGIGTGFLFDNRRRDRDSNPGCNFRRTLA